MHLQGLELELVTGHCYGGEDGDAVGNSDRNTRKIGAARCGPRWYASRAIVRVGAQNLCRSRPSIKNPVVVLTRRFVCSEEKPAQPPARRPPTHIEMPAKQASGAAKRKRRRDTPENDAHQSDARDFLPVLLPQDIMDQILGQANLPDPLDLANLKAVNRGMRDAVVATGRKVQELDSAKAAELGCLRSLQCLLRRDRLEKGRIFDHSKFTVSTFDIGARSGGANACHQSVCNLAARGGHLEVLKWAVANKCSYDELTHASAASGGNLEVLQYLDGVGCKANTDSCAAAALNGHFHVLQWLRETGYPWNERTCASAARGGHLEVLKWARANECPWDDYMCAEAASGGHLEVLQWLRAEKGPWDKRTCKFAAECGHLEVLQWARANGCLWNAQTCACAARGGKLVVLQWARANGAPWDEQTCAFAAGGGQLEALQWARANGCPWDMMTYGYALQYGHREVASWAHANDCQKITGVSDRKYEVDLICDMGEDEWCADEGEWS